MFELQLSLDDAGQFAAIADTVAHLDEWLAIIVPETVVGEVAPAILPEAQAEPPSVKTPIAWTSPRQRRYVKLMQKRGVIPFPYVRNHGISQGWAFTVTITQGKGITVELGNSAPGFEWIEGDQQQGWHRATGWINAAEKSVEWGNTTVTMIATSIGERWEQLKADAQSH